ncbi:LPS-assembly protein LptD [Hylemonella gracilis]|uniref:LPS-assembly protein LptD n=1 Tax=Hylemonella gracilis ATCC 19624 TaxID=887062 RepID=F3KWS4_9BURK|nr:LPS assembly protein LptD [Hylemonella gracilis]EGI75711.1 organic solvent tolerance protein [Hylemonella gracilis ATCC 19624]
MFRSDLPITRYLLALLCLLMGGAADAELKLKVSPLLQDRLTAQQRAAAPSFVEGQRMESEIGIGLLAEDDVEFRRADLVLRAQKLEYDQATDTAHARGSVRVNQSGNVFEGDTLDLRVDAFEGSFTNARFYLLSADAHGDAERIDFLDDTRSVVQNATFTTCRREGGPDWVPAWFLRATTLHLDSEEGVAEAEDTTVRFQNVPVLGLPAMTFPLSGERRSGMLSPVYGADNVSGTEITVPYYLNIAPNRDATLYPTWMSERGVNYGGEFRYLEPGYSGLLRVDYMPDDKLRDMDREGYYFQHRAGVSGAYGSLGLNLNISRVSDDNYWRDFPRASNSLTQRLLPADVSVNWGQGPYSATARVLRYQTLQVSDAPIVPPYDRQQLTARYAEPNFGGFDFSLDGDYTQFTVDELALTSQSTANRVNADRTVWRGALSYPIRGAAGFVIPKASIHATSYQFEQALDLSSYSGSLNGLSADASSATRTVPTYSLDAGLVFEREASYFGSAYRQTLEPRLFYTRTPFVEQGYLPNYDSAAQDFSLTSIYSENTFMGNDRIADNNLLTVGVSTRLFDAERGAEILHLGVAQRLRFEDQRVTLPGGTASPEGLSDLLLGAELNIDPRWHVDSAVQWNDRLGESERSTFSMRYNPSPYRVVNLAYRFQRAQSETSEDSELINLGWQWPINDLWRDWGEDLGPGRGQGAGRWYSVGRLNYSQTDHKLVDTTMGFEYDAGCWLGRFVFERLQTGLTTANQRIMFQLELVGFGRVGVDPLQTLQKNIPRYQLLREQTTSPSRFSNYE